NNCAEGKRFARWWRDRLNKYCFNDTANNLFTDQRWADLVPAMFEQVHILRDYGCNVATWNLTHRQVEGEFSSGFTVNGRPLVFYHFSGMDSGRQLFMLNKYGRGMPSLSSLRNWYLDQCKQYGDDSPQAVSWHYGRFDNGVEITAEHRKIYKETPHLLERFPDPFKTNGCSYYNFYQTEYESRTAIPEKNRNPAYEPIILLLEESKAHGDQSPDAQAKSDEASKMSMPTAGHESGSAEDLLHFPIFDPEYYLETYPEVALSGSDPFVHYCLTGASELKNPGPIFNARFYTSMVNSSEVIDNPLAHFLSFGWKDLLSPHPLFDTAFYLERNEDVKASGVNPLSHFITDGWMQMRDPHPLFDVSYYLKQNPDVKHSGINPLAHFLKYGAREGRSPHPLFDTEYYLRQNPDAANATESPLEHFINTHARRASNPHPLFDCQYYLSQLPECDREKAKGNPLVHFLRAENNCFDPHPNFDMTFYRNKYPDVAAAGVDPLLHYVTCGEAEGRSPAKQPLAASVEPSREVEPVCDLKLAAFKAAATDERPALLFIGQADPGGTRTHIADLCRLLDGRARILMLRPSPSAVFSRVELSIMNSQANEIITAHNVEFDLKHQFAQLTDFLHALKLTRVHVHNLEENEHYLKHLIDKLAIPFDFTLHDYYVLSPLLHLTDETGNFAGEPDEGNAAIHLSGIDAKTNQSGEFIKTETMAAWRARHAWLIEGAERIIAPSLDAKQRFRHHHPEKSILAAYHPGACALGIPVKANALAKEQFLKVLIVGQIGNHKGAVMLESCALLSRQKQLPIAFKLIGSSSYPLTTYPNTELTVHGSYQLDKLPDLIASINPHLCWFPGQCAETFSYTFSEICKLGLPVLVPAIGAFPERAAGRPWSFVAPLDTTAEEWLDLIIQIRNNHFLTGIGPEPYMKGSSRACFDFYENRYLSRELQKHDAQSKSEIICAQPVAAPGKMK
ncbi:MAG: hypothetical protein IT342_03090, partial [Candidatus Melainabacteria bacterium]|nr:hypothetical protein [Candidatus Melainabacteria bacterium]